MKIKKKHLLAFLLIFGLLVLAGCGASGDAPENSGDTTQNTAQNTDGVQEAEAAAGDTGAGFREYPIGEEKIVENMKIAAVYFQPSVMEPAGKGLTPDQADAHIEADIAAVKGNDVGFGVGQWIPYLTVNYVLKNLDSGKEVKGTFMPMSATDGPHYGANIKIPGAGKYELKFLIDSPEKNGYLLHVDEATGVDGRFWKEPIEVSWEFNWVPRKW